MNQLLFIVFIGIGATAVTDLWGIVRKTLLGIPPPNYGMVGRWIAHMAHGQFRHDSIAASSPRRAEHFIGWVAHYLIGTAFAALLIGIWGESWIDNPTIGPALVVGIGTVAAPFLLMQPGMGAGFAASRTKDPTAARLQSLITHTVFGLGLFVSGWATQITQSL
ncbi:DUF2938 domain-containing protein [Marinobacter salarius]|jgi:DUF2938 family protein|uniref:Membrane protein n=1 Tax=Marinobacter salarius TaxID=1420917 RepID=A0A1W6KFE1_9GAMM|nr:DUF2938 domain-containing protein [Marinobacter salarius]ARM86032.1 membrane protein [Marinobacter salarius]MCC4283926.1 DUF2938 domain-containing protein [Marinobacter salarius]